MKTSHCFHLLPGDLSSTSPENVICKRSVFEGFKRMTKGQPTFIFPKLKSHIVLYSERIIVILAHEKICFIYTLFSDELNIYFIQICKITASQQYKLGPNLIVKLRFELVSQILNLLSTIPPLLIKISVDMPMQFSAS